MSLRWVLLAMLAVGGCNSTGVGNPAPVALQLSITRDDAEAQGGDGNAAGAPTTDAGQAGRVDSAILVVGEIRFLPCDPNPDEDSVAVGPFIIDLIHGGTSPIIPEVLVPPGGFCGFDAPLAPATRPARLVGRSVYFDGVRADGTPFHVYANLQATLRVRARPGVSWNPRPEPKSSVFWALRPRRWVDSGELDALSAADDGSGNLVIDVERHPLLLRALRSRLAGSSTLYDDVDADNVFDPQDRDAVIGDGLPDAD
jgi:hypothetical protein